MGEFMTVMGSHPQENGVPVKKRTGTGSAQILEKQINQPGIYTSGIQPEYFGSREFKNTYQTMYTLYAGSMANGISSTEMVIAMGKAGMLASFGAGGLLPGQVEAAINTIQRSLPDGPYAFNLINSPNEPAVEQNLAELYIRYTIPVIEASAYLRITPALVWYRVSGLENRLGGEIGITRHIIAKVSHPEIARRFMEPPPARLVQQLLDEQKITPSQAEMAGKVPMADDITVEADSGGHTDNRPLVSILPVIISLRDTLQQKYAYAQPIRIGAAGGISSPSSALAAYMLGAEFICTGSINQSCIESGTSDKIRALLAGADVTDTAMAPAADMFESGVRVQVIKKGSLFSARSTMLFDLYREYGSIDELPAQVRATLEDTLFRDTLDNIWAECRHFFGIRDPQRLAESENDPKKKMALIFRWYLGLSSVWARDGLAGREMDYQVWCGPSMGAFNSWVKGTDLEPWKNRKVAEVNLRILTGAADLFQEKILKISGLNT